jgi:two-component system NarL family sensor kinase
MLTKDDNLKFSSKDDLLYSLDIQNWYLKAFAREIYENVGQILSLAKLQLHTVNLKEKTESEKVIESSGKLLEKAIRDLRNLARQLSPKEVIQKGFAYAMEYELHRLEESGFCKTSFMMQGNLHRFDNIKELVLFCSLQQIINSALQEDRAENLEFEICYNKQMMKSELAYFPLISGSGTIQAKNNEERITEKLQHIGAEILFESIKGKKRITTSLKK